MLKPYYENEHGKLYCGNCQRLRDAEETIMQYQAFQDGLEAIIYKFIAKMDEINNVVVGWQETGNDASAWTEMKRIYDLSYLPPDIKRKGDSD